MQLQPIFRDRADAGKILAERVAESVQSPGSLVLALPRGGVPVAFEVARKLRAQLDIFLVRKLGMPGQEELAIGAIASGGVRVLNEGLIHELQLSRPLIDRITAREELELRHREELYRQGRTAVPVGGRTVILVDDGLATGASMKAAAQALRLQTPSRIIVAVPVAARDTCSELSRSVDEIICAYTPSPFTSVGGWYADFAQTTDEEVRQLLNKAREEATVRQVPHAS